MADSNGAQDKKNGLPAHPWDAEEPEVVSSASDDELLWYTGACDIFGSPISLPYGHDLGELRALGVHIGPAKGSDKNGRVWRADDHEGPFDEEELPALYFEAGAYHSLHNVLPGDNPQFMLPGDATCLSTPYKEMIAESQS